MLRRFVGAFLFAVASSACPMHAQTIVHELSNISIPAKIDDLNLQALGKPGIIGGLATLYTLRNQSDIIEIKIMRASYPSASLWFGQTLGYTRQLFSSVGLSVVGNSEVFTNVSEKPNGIRALYKVNAPFVSASIAVEQFGEWIVVIRSVSKSVDVDRQRTRLDKLISLIVPPKSATDSFPLTLPAECPATKTTDFTVELEPPLEAVSIEMKTSAGLVAAIASNESSRFAKTGIAAQPLTYCRRYSASGRSVWYESLSQAEPNHWVRLVDETGLTVEGVLVPIVDKKGRVSSVGAVLTNEISQTSVRGFFSSWPNPIRGHLNALISYGEKTSPYVSVPYGTNSIKNAK
jgi:hypothetical protein